MATSGKRAALDEADPEGRSTAPRAKYAKRRASMIPEASSIQVPDFVPPQEAKRLSNILRKRNILIADNSLRETVVGSIHGHTLPDKKKIFRWSQACGFDLFIVAALGHDWRVEDDWLAWLFDTYHHRERPSPTTPALTARAGSNPSAHSDTSTQLTQLPVVQSASDSLSNAQTSHLAPVMEENPLSRCFAFCDLADAIAPDGTMTLGAEDRYGDHVSSTLAKLEKYHVRNIIIEIDLGAIRTDAYRHAHPSEFSEGTGPNESESIIARHYLSQLLNLLDNVVFRHMAPSTLVMLNLRDFPVAMHRCPQRVLAFVALVACLESSRRPIGLMFEDPIGAYPPADLELLTQKLRETMDCNGWHSGWQAQPRAYDGLLLAHVHEQWGMADLAQLYAVAGGADGVWCSAAAEGAAVGHASSTVLLANLMRLGNTDVTRYNLPAILPAARQVTRLTIEQRVPVRQVVYGSAALDAPFAFGNIAGGTGYDQDVDWNGDGQHDALDQMTAASFFGLQPPVRITELSPPADYLTRCIEIFGQYPLFSDPQFGDNLSKHAQQEVREHEQDQRGLEFSTPRSMAQLVVATLEAPPYDFSATSPNPEAPGYEEYQLARELALNGPAHHGQNQSLQLLQDAQAYFVRCCKELDPNRFQACPGKCSLSVSAFVQGYLYPHFSERPAFSLATLGFLYDNVGQTDVGQSAGTASASAPSGPPPETLSLNLNEWLRWCDYVLYSMDVFTLQSLHLETLRRVVLTVPRTVHEQHALKKFEIDAQAWRGDEFRRYWPRAHGSHPVSKIQVSLDTSHHRALPASTLPIDVGLGSDSYLRCVRDMSSPAL
ncbi:uncharacterized protein MONBRDRAFT_29104 [Monosiga brevicollis MX1]|uniref:Uncharacterized protein n=1 Tax=Monosiga brevicollis TaxID=81824 RepID=A9VA49_MONBE|nr:uncharacterized protein MONBRDRAFT_29104 [Monosiga brevicollis MX1]EDQ85603.1 predicted protein [Monosiga brevicollis MX1]|eukprot:XP_001749552.1 hypothetical protein [Monosiga brevicollis MX1]